jgi:Cu(I)-responsive transcriptional regulator
MQIGQLATRSETKVETIRYYERIGLLVAPARSPSGYRQYSQEHLQQLMFVRHCRDMGFSISEIRSLQLLAHDPKRSCAEVTALAKTHLLDVRTKLAGLRRLERTLGGLITSCDGRRVADCQILKELGASGINAVKGVRRP